MFMNVSFFVDDHRDNIPFIENNMSKMCKFKGVSSKQPKAILFKKLN